MRSTGEATGHPRSNIRAREGIAGVGGSPLQDSELLKWQSVASEALLVQAQEIHAALQSAGKRMVVVKSTRGNRSPTKKNSFVLFSCINIDI
jgi:hypothetical protein